jgi:type IV secretory pathway VirB4 component
MMVIKVAGIDSGAIPANDWIGSAERVRQLNRKISNQRFGIDTHLCPDEKSITDSTASAWINPHISFSQNLCQARNSKTADNSAINHSPTESTGNVEVIIFPIRNSHLHLREGDNQR